MIKLIYKNIKRKPFNILVFVLCTIIWACNECYLKKATSGVVNYIAVCYLNDYLAPILFLSYVNIILSTRNVEINRLYSIIMICLINGMIWEYLAPYVKEDSVADILDILAYLIGGITYWLIIKKLGDSFT